MGVEAEGQILIADDEEIFRIPTVGLLEREGYQCDSAASTEEALKYLQKPYEWTLGCRGTWIWSL